MAKGCGFFVPVTSYRLPGLSLCVYDATEDAMIIAWICPICRDVLELSGTALRCPVGHSFDLAKERYVNLMVGRQRAGFKGDTPDMLTARRRHFERGLYASLRQEIIFEIGKIKHNRVADIGCGEGYYIGGISEHINDSMCFGTDIAKDGVRLAAKRYERVRFAVADTNLLIPLPDRSVDVLLNVFAPRNPSEFVRVLASDGYLLIVIPTARHLAELREVQPLLAIQEDKRQAVEQALTSWFRLVDSKTLTVPLSLGHEAVLDLVKMTPNDWFLTNAQKQVLGNIDRLEVTAEFELLKFHLH